MSLEEQRRTVLRLDKARLVESALHAATVVAVVLLLDDDLGEILELRVLAALLACYVLLTLANYGVHVLFRDRTRDEQMRKQWREWREARRRRRAEESEQGEA